MRGERAGGGKCHFLIPSLPFPCSTSQDRILTLKTDSNSVLFVENEWNKLDEIEKKEESVL